MKTLKQNTTANESNNLTFFENTILNNINTIDYLDKELTNNFDKINFVYKTFESEYKQNNNKHINEVILFREWLQGLPSVLTVPFYNFDILENAKKYGYILNTEEKEDTFLETYFLNCSKSFFTLKENTPKTK